MLVIRLRRTGKKKKPSFRVIVAEKTMPIYGRFVDIVGNVNLQVQPKQININKDKALSWMEKGAKPTQTVSRLMIKTGILKEEDVVKKPDKKRLKKKEAKLEKGTEEKVKESQPAAGEPKTEKPLTKEGKNKEDEPLEEVSKKEEETSQNETKESKAEITEKEEPKDQN